MAEVESSASLDQASSQSTHLERNLRSPKHAVRNSLVRKLFRRAIRRSAAAAKDKSERSKGQNVEPTLTEDNSQRMNLPRLGTDTLQESKRPLKKRPFTIEPSQSMPSTASTWSTQSPSAKKAKKHKTTKASVSNNRASASTGPNSFVPDSLPKSKPPSDGGQNTLVQHAGSVQAKGLD